MAFPIKMFDQFCDVTGSLTCRTKYGGLFPIHYAAMRNKADILKSMIGTHGKIGYIWKEMDLASWINLNFVIFSPGINGFLRDNQGLIFLLWCFLVICSFPILISFPSFKMNIIFLSYLFFSGNTPVHLAVKNNSVDALKALVEAGYSMVSLPLSLTPSLPLSFSSLFSFVLL